MQLIVPLVSLSCSALVIAQAAPEATIDVIGELVTTFDGDAEEAGGATKSTVFTSSEEEDSTIFLTESLTSTVDSEFPSSTHKVSPKGGNHSEAGLQEQSENGAEGHLKFVTGSIAGLALAAGVLLI